jgi:hypothetical protein
VQYFSDIDDLLLLLKKYDVSPQRGFLPTRDPLQRLSHEKYYLWEDMADDLPKLLGARLGQVREPLSRLPVISIDKLETPDELRRAHFLLCLFAHAYVFIIIIIMNSCLFSLSHTYLSFSSFPPLYSLAAGLSGEVHL